MAQSPSHAVGSEHDWHPRAEAIYVLSPSHTVGLERTQKKTLYELYYDEVSIPHGGLRTMRDLEREQRELYSLHPTRWAWKMGHPR